MNRIKKCTRVKNPCKICLQQVSNKNGLQCKGACKRWAHFTCLNYTPGKIQDIKAGIITVTCPCPTCNVGETPKEIIKDASYTCTNNKCPANIAPPKCEHSPIPEKGDNPCDAASRGQTPPRKSRCCQQKVLPVEPPCSKPVELIQPQRPTKCPPKDNEPPCSVPVVPCPPPVPADPCPPAEPPCAKPEPRVKPKKPEPSANPDPCTIPDPYPKPPELPCEKPEPPCIEPVQSSLCGKPVESPPFVKPVASPCADPVKKHPDQSPCAEPAKESKSSQPATPTPVKFPCKLSEELPCGQPNETPPCGPAESPTCSIPDLPPCAQLPCVRPPCGKHVCDTFCKSAVRTTHKNIEIPCLECTTNMQHSQICGACAQSGYYSKKHKKEKPVVDKNTKISDEKCVDKNSSSRLEKHRLPDDIIKLTKDGKRNKKDKQGKKDKNKGGHYCCAGARSSDSNGCCTDLAKNSCSSGKAISCSCIAPLDVSGLNLNSMKPECVKSSSDSALTKESQKVLLCTIHELCSTVGHLSEQVKELLSKMMSSMQTKTC